jgi:2-keto-3-deoxy-L-rhamnonate aldolase RhmA
MKQPFRRLIKTGEILIGTVVTLSAPQVPEILAQCGFDWPFVNGEHSPLSSSDIEGIVRSAGLCPCLVRIRDQSEASIKSALDSGAAGIIAPFVNSAEEAKRIVSLCRYPPEGCRSMGVSRANEGECGRWSYEPWIKRHALDIYQVDLARNGFTDSLVIRRQMENAGGRVVNTVTTS